MKSYIRLASLLLFMAVSAPAFAAFTNVTCTVSSTSLNFGTYNDASSTATNVAAPSFTFTCCRNAGPGSQTGVVTISLGPSANSGAINTRQMKNTVNTDLMNYQLYQNAFGGTVWGDGVTGGSVFTQSVTVTARCAATQTFAAGSLIYGQIPARQPVSAGNYTDSVTITVSP